MVIGLAVLLLLGTGFAVLRVQYEGEDLGSNIASILNKRMRGRVAIGSVEWSAASLKKVITGGWVHLTLRDVSVWDDCALSSGAAPEVDAIRTGDPNEDCTPDDRPDADPNSKRKPRKLLLRTSLIEADIDIHALLFGNHDFVFKDLWVHGGEALLEETARALPAPRLRPRDRLDRLGVLSADDGGLLRAGSSRTPRRRSGICATSTSRTST